MFLRNLSSRTTLFRKSYLEGFCFLCFLFLLILITKSLKQTIPIGTNIPHSKSNCTTKHDLFTRHYSIPFLLSPPSRDINSKQ